MLLLRILKIIFSKDNYEDIYNIFNTYLTKIYIIITNSFILKTNTIIKKLYISSIEVTRFLLLKTLFFKINIEKILKSSRNILLRAFIYLLLRLSNNLILLIFLISKRFSLKEINLKEILLI